MNYPYKFGIVLLAFFCSSLAYTQVKSVDIQVVSKRTQEAIAYAHIMNKSLKKGTISDINGKAMLNYQNLADTVLLSYVGYKRYETTIEQLTKESTIRLEQHTEALDEVVVLSDDGLLYDLVKACRRNASTDRLNSKVYFELASYANNHQIEQLENYYNGHLIGADLQSLNLYMGRVGINAINNITFFSPETSETFYRHKTFKGNTLFPESPLSLSHQKLRKSYALSLSRSYVNEEGQSIYVIEFEPNDKIYGFTGKVFINADQSTVLKINLKAKQSKVHPFVPMFKGDSLLNVDLELNKTFQVIDNQSVLQSIDFMYDVHYLNRQQVDYVINTRAIMYAYDFKELFPAPMFEYPKNDLDDYRKISLTPFNDAFWSQHEEFRVHERGQEIDQFIQHAEWANDALFAPLEMMNLRSDVDVNPYRRWGRDRVEIVQPTKNRSENLSNPALKSELYNLSVKLYVDVTAVDDQLTFRSYTIFDPYESFYDLPVDSTTNAMINIYFDLYELQRRELEKELATCTTYKEAKDLYNKHLAKADATANEFLGQVDLGTNEKYMTYWNGHVLRNLGIDNLLFFGKGSKVNLD